MVSLHYPLDILVSFYYFNDDRMSRLVVPNCWRIIGDSGAFSAHTLGKTINVNNYARWCHTWWNHLCWAASLDVIGDPVTSFANWTRLRDRHHLLTVPTVHAGAGTEWIDQYASEGADLIGLGGMAGTGMAPRAYRWTVHAVRHVRDRWPHVRLHLWGMTSPRYLSALPVWSADSSGITGAAYRYARLSLFDPDRGRFWPIELHGRSAYRHGRLLRSVYGVDPATITGPGRHNRGVLARLSAASAQRYGQWLRDRHQVTAPTMYRNVRDRSVTGPRVHLVDSTINNYLYLCPTRDSKENANV